MTPPPLKFCKKIPPTTFGPAHVCIADAEVITLSFETLYKLKV